VAYTYGGGIDRPLSVVRMGYVNRQPGEANGLFRWDDFSIVPHWNAHGRAQTGTFHSGVRFQCRAGYTNWCVQLSWPEGMFPYNPARGALEHWHGTLLTEKRDASGLLYRRNRYYDPSTGRFTQEDPIGLAGGINVYGFAAGDPVNYSDPYGLSPCLLYPKLCDVVAGAAIGAAIGAATQAARNVANDRPLTEGVGRAAIEGGVVGGVLGGVATVARSLRGAQLADEVGRAGAGSAAARTLLREGDAVLGVVHEGKVIAQTSNVSLSHAAFVERTLGSLPAGAEVVTIGKFEGVITVLRSPTFHGRGLPASREAFDAARAIFR
jgi:RHS repeat-associated protein